MPMSVADKKAAQIADVEFVLAECGRIKELLASTPPAEWKNLPRDELIGSLPHPSGRGAQLFPITKPQPVRSFPLKRG